VEVTTGAVGGIVENVHETGDDSGVSSSERIAVPSVTV
jgi:hypothetical protein